MIPELWPHGGNMVPEIKICGLTAVREAEYLNECSVNYAGFVFYPPSKRYVTIEQAREIASALDGGIRKVAVLVSPAESEIDMIQNAGFINILQIHKELSPPAAGMAALPIWRALNIGSASDADHLTELAYSHIPDEHRHKIEAVLADAPDFGSGRTFDWKEGHRPEGIKNLKFVLAGGLNPSNVAEGIRIFGPDTVDVSSGVEGENGKDAELIRDFVYAVRNMKAREA